MVLLRVFLVWLFTEGGLTHDFRKEATVRQKLKEIIERSVWKNIDRYRIDHVFWDLAKYSG